MTNTRFSAILDEGRVRLTWTSFALTLEELPRKPCVRQLRSCDFNTWYAVHARNHDAFLIPNMLKLGMSEAELSMDSLITPASTYDNAVAALWLRRESLLNMYPDVSRDNGAPLRQATRHYTLVAPADAPPKVIQGRDFRLKLSWTEFSTYAPGADFGQPDPYYQEYHQTSAAGARKLYKLAREHEAELREMNWGALLHFFHVHSIPYDITSSIWR